MNLNDLIERLSYNSDDTGKQGVALLREVRAALLEAADFVDLEYGFDSELEVKLRRLVAGDPK